MKEITTREKILSRIRNVSLLPYENPFGMVDMDAAVYMQPTDSDDITFAQEFAKLGGKFIYCENKKYLAENFSALLAERKWEKICCPDPQLRGQIAPGNSHTGIFSETDETCHVGITRCEYLIARTGSILVSSNRYEGRTTYISPEVHIVIAYISQVVHDLKDAFELLKEKYGDDIPSMVSVISGASRTADIEKTLVMGAHGPRELYVLLTED